MIDSIIEWSLRNRFIVVLMGVALFVWGTWEATRMPVDVFPSLSATTVPVIIEAHGMAPEEIETQVVYPIETALSGASGVRRVRSATGIGNSVIWAEFDWSTDIFRARQLVSERLQSVRSSLPPEVEPPTMAPISSIMGEIMFVALTSDKHSPIELRTEADWNVRRRLLSVPGIAQVIPIGGGVKQYQVVVRPERLAAYEMALDTIVGALEHSNVNVSAGFLKENGREYLIYGMGRFESVADIESTLLEVRNGQPITVGDLATVEVASALSRGDGSFNAQRAVVISIQKQPDANTLELTKRLDDVMADIQRTLPEGMTLHTKTFRQADFISVAVDNVMGALLDGSILVIIIILLFLMSGRATLITATAIPLSLLASVMVLKGMGGSINTMTLGGMAIAVGAIVDDAIVDVENIVRRLRLEAELEESERRSVFEVIFEASREVRASIVFATLIIVLVFVPLFFLSGVEGRLLQPLGIAYVVSLGASLVVALTITPALCYYLLPGSSVVTSDHDGPALRLLKRFYGPVLEATIHRWQLLTVGAVLALAAAGFGLWSAGRAFLPEFNEGALTVSAVTLPGTSLETSDALGFMVEEVLLSHSEVVTTLRRTGRAELDEHAQRVNSTEVEVTLKESERSRSEFLAALRADLAKVPGMNITIGQPISHRIDHMLSGTRANLAVKIFGPDLHQLRQLANRVNEVMQGVDGIVDLNVEQQMDVPFVVIDFDREGIARHGLHVQDVAEVVETAFVGHEVTRVIEGRKGFELLVRYPAKLTTDVESIRDTLVSTPKGARVPLRALADIRRDRRPNSISRENGERKIVVSANVSDSDLVGVVQATRMALQEQVPMPDGYHIEYGGQFESAEEASRTLSLLTAGVIVGIFLLLLVSLGSTRDALFVMANLPLALIGGVVGMWALDGVLSVASLIGFITLFGVATRNGLLLVTHIKHLQSEEGVTNPVEAVRRGAMERLAPITMTALASGAGLVPLAMAAGQAGGELQAPMAWVILFGLVSSTVLNMVVVPSLYLRFGRFVTSSDEPR